MAKETLTFAFLALMAITAHAQHFDWVKHYHGQHDNYLSTGIMRTATDSEGNLYVMGRFTSDAAIDGTHLNPLTYALNSENRCLLVAKFNPEGQMVWHKIIYKYEYPNRADVLPLGMRLVGDSALMVMANFDTPYREDGADHRLYYLDTLLRDRGYPYPVDSVSQWEATAFITLGLNDGGLREHHFVQCALLDSVGQPFGNQYGWQALPLSSEDFDLDSRGNIYVTRWVANDRFLFADRPSVEDGRVQGLRLIVDGQRFIDYTLPHRVGRWNQQVMKFAPHFDTLLAARYIVDSSTLLEGAADTTVYLQDIFCLQSFNIHGDNLYLCLYNNNLLDGAVISGDNSMVLHARHSEGALLKMDTSLVPQLLVQPDHWPQQEGQVASCFYNTAYDADSNSLFVLADYWSRAMTLTDFTPSVAYRGDTLDLCSNLCFLRLNPGDGRLLTYGKAGSSAEFRNDYYGYPGLAVRNNRVVSTVKYHTDIFFGDTVVSLADPAAMALGLVVWDYAGHEIEYHDFGAVGNSNMVGPCALHDSSLYFAVTAFSSATFGQHVLPGANTCIVRYVDTAFAHPYKYVERHADQHISWAGYDTIYVGSYYGHRTVDLTATASSGLPVTYHLSDTAMCHLLNNGQVWINDTGICLITATQPGNSYWNAAEPVTKVLYVGVEGRIVWTQPLDFTYSDTVILLDAFFTTATGTNIYYSLPAGNGVAELLGDNRLHLLGPGTVDIEATSYQYNPDSDDHHFHLTRTLTVHPAEPIGIEIAVPDNVKVYPNPFRQKVTIKVESGELKVVNGVVTAILTDLTGRREEVRLTPTAPGQYTLNLSSRPQSTYLLTLTTADGHQHTVRLLKQSDIFGN